MLYDVVRKKPIGKATIALSGPTGGLVISTDRLGRYVVDVPRGMSGSLNASLKRFRPGLAADREPSLRSFGDKERRDLAGQIDAGEAPMPDAPRNGNLRFDLVAIPDTLP